MDLIFTLNQIDAAATSFISFLNDCKVVAVNGEMGAGKTTFIHAVCRQLLVADKMSSPTYSIINQYRTINGLIVNHVDLYRVKDAEEAIQAGVEDILSRGDLCFIEWPEKIMGILPLHVVNAFLEITDSGSRKLVARFS